MFCTKCGARHDDNASFCTACGAALGGNTPQSAAEPTVNINEFFPCGIFQPPGTKVFGVVNDGIVYGKEIFHFDKIDGLHRQTDSTGVTNGVYQMNAYGRTFLLVYRHSDQARAHYALDYAQQMIAKAHGTPVSAPSTEGLLYDLNGVRGRHLQIYEDRVVLKVTVGIGSFLTGNVSDGEKTIYFSDCIGVQFKESGLQIGYLQFETAGRLMNNATSNFFNENSFTWDTTVQTNEFMRQIAEFVKGRVSYYKQQKNAPSVAAFSPADELKKYKELLDMGVISQEEFDKKKNQLLGF